MDPELDASFWEGRYQAGSTPWDLGEAAPPFQHLLRSPHAPSPGRMAVLGSGRGHDALLFAAHGFEAIGFDFAPSAIQAAMDIAQAQGSTAQFLQRNLFYLADEFAHQFDYVLEHTCFCAIDPQQWDDYVQVVHSLLRPQGELIALFWAHSRSGGPPFGASLTDIRRQFASYFNLVWLEPAADSVASRRGDEYLIRFQAKS